MAPNSGGQYQWVSEFAPPSMQKSLSYAVGWSSTIGWIAGVPACAIQLAGMIQEMVAVKYPDTGFDKAWQVTLVMFAFIFFTVGFNIFAARQLPGTETGILILHIAAFVVFLVIFWATPASHTPASDVFGNFYNGGGWPTTGLSCLVGLTSPVWCFIGPDAGAHMSEELQDASLQLPRAMMWSIFLNGVMGITILISFCFCINNVQEFVNLVSSRKVGENVLRLTGESYSLPTIQSSSSYTNPPAHTQQRSFSALSFSSSYSSQR